MKSKLSILCLVFFLTNAFCEAQVKFKKGLYKDFENIENNQPSDSLKYPIESKSKMLGVSAIPDNSFKTDKFNLYNPEPGFTNHLDKYGRNDGRAKYYRLKIKRKEAIELGEIIGFSDGINLYVSIWQVNPALKSSLFSPAERINDSIYIFDRHETSIGSAYEERYIFNTKGYTRKLTVDYMTQLLERNSDLSSKFERERSKEGLLLLYLMKLLDDGKN